MYAYTTAGLKTIIHKLKTINESQVKYNPKLKQSFNEITEKLSDITNSFCNMQDIDNRLPEYCIVQLNLLLLLLKRINKSQLKNNLIKLIVNERKKLFAFKQTLPQSVLDGFNEELSIKENITEKRTLDLKQQATIMYRKDFMRKVKSLIRYLKKNSNSYNDCIINILNDLENKYIMLLNKENILTVTLFNTEVTALFNEIIALYEENFPEKIDELNSKFKKVTSNSYLAMYI